jgi:hypothetical protein
MGLDVRQGLIVVEHSYVIASEEPLVGEHLLYICNVAVIHQATLIELEKVR